jgi:tetratricopeptide (TPR) repeat protein
MSDVYDGIHKLLKSKQYDNVLDLLVDRTTHEIKPCYQSDMNHACYIAGDIYFKMKNYLIASEFFKKAILDFPEDGEALHALANCYSEIGDYDLAKTAYESALVHDPENPVIKYNYANTLFDIGEHGKAKKIYESIPDDAGEVYWLSLKNLKRLQRR